MIRKLSFVVFGLLLISPVNAAGENPGASRCQVYIDYQVIWTFEVVELPGSPPTPILNIITLTSGTWELRPNQIHIQNGEGREANVDKFSIDTGGEPYDTPFMKVLGNSFIGLDLLGDFTGFGEPTKVQIDLGDDRYTLAPIDCLDYEMLADRINNVNFDSPDVKEDFRVLGIEQAGNVEALPRR